MGGAAETPLFLVIFSQKVGFFEIYHAEGFSIYFKPYLVIVNQFSVSPRDSIPN